MAVKKFNTRIQLKRDSSTNFASFTPLAGELLVVTDKNNVKIGDGTTGFGSLPYLVGGAVLASYTAPTSDTTGAVAATDTLNQALAKLQKGINDAAAGGVLSIDSCTGAVTLGNGLESTQQANGAVSVKTTGYITASSAGVDIDSSKIDDDYTVANNTDLATVATVIAALDTLDVDNTTGITGFGAGKTLATLTETNGKIAATFQDIEIAKSQITGFSDNDYATAAQGTAADNALQSISHGTDGTYVTTTIGTKTNNDQTVGVAVTVQAMSTADSSHMGLAEASDVKTYVDNKTADLSGAMHFRSVITTGDGAGQDYVSLINAFYTNSNPAIEAEVGDVFVDSTSGKEYVVKSLPSTGDLTSSNIEEFGSVNPSTTVASVTGSTNTTGLVVTPTTASTGAVTVSVNTDTGYAIPTTTQLTKVDNIAVTAPSSGSVLGSVTDGTTTLSSIVTDANYAHITVTQTSVSDGTTTFNKYTHPTATAATADAVKVGNDAEGHVVLGAHLVSSDINLVSGDPAYDANATKTVSDSLKALNTAISQVATPGTLSTSSTSQSEVSGGEAMSGNITLHTVAKTGKISDLVQTAPETAGGVTNTIDLVIFDCGSATTNTNDVA